jgi:hypothetical protein
MNFSFDFLGIDDVYFTNYLANELIRWVVFKSFTSIRALSTPTGSLNNISYDRLKYRLILAA